MLHHISFGVANIERSAAFYDAAFEPIGYVRVWEDLTPGDPDQAIGYGLPGGGDKFTIKLRGEDAQCPGAGFHLAFTAPSRSAVTLFHKAAMDPVISRPSLSIRMDIALKPSARNPNSHRRVSVGGKLALWKNHPDGLAVSRKS